MAFNTFAADIPNAEIILEHIFSPFPEALLQLDLRVVYLATGPAVLESLARSIRFNPHSLTSQQT
jgi:hypothetical protein